jgi:hypothetical protein
MTYFTKLSCVLFLALLFLSVEIKADPIQILTGTASLTLGSRFNLSGSNGTQFIGTSIGGNNFPSMPYGAGSIFNPTTNIFAPYGQSANDFRGVSIINGVSTPVVYGGYQAVPNFSSLIFSSANFQLPSQMLPTFTMSIPFAMQGILIGIVDCTATFPCGQVATNTSVYGAGTANYSFYSQNGSYFLGSANYTFDNNSPTPEPATLILMGTGLAGIIGFARKRRNKQPE